mgnify:FL=1
MEEINIFMNGTVVTRDDANRVIKDGVVVCQGDKIRSVGKRGEIPELPQGANIIDAKGSLIMPGYINPHSHAYCSLVRGYQIPGFVPDGFMDNLRNKWWFVDGQFTIEQCRSMAEVSFLEAVKNGVTTEFDHHASYGAVTGSLAQFSEAAEQIGLRTCLCFEVSDRAGKEAARQAVNENIRCIKEAKPNPIRKGMMGLHASFTLSDETLAYAAERMESENAYHIHIAECREDEEDCQKRYACSITKRLERFGMLGEKTLIAHGVYLDGEELSLIKEKNAMVVTNPESNMNNGVDMPPWEELCRRNIITGFGMDGFGHDVPTVWRIGNALYKYKTRDINSGWTQLPEMIFEGNAQIASTIFETKIGKLQKGYQADVIVVDYQPPTPLDETTVNAHLLFGTGGKDTVTTMCNGRLLMKDRRMLTTDEEKIEAESRKQAEKLWRHCNMIRTGGEAV